MNTPDKIIELNFKDAVDITSDLQKAIEKNKGNRTVIYLPKGRYKIHSTIKLHNDTTIIGSDNRGNKSYACR